MPTVAFHGGNLLPNVEVQGLYLGSQWVGNPALASQVPYLDGFLNSIVHSTYMDALTNAGYGVGRGSYTPGKIEPFVTRPNINRTIAEDIQIALTNDITNHKLQSPDANTLYVVFTEPNYQYYSYHGAFDWLPQGVAGHPKTIRYAVIPYGNANLEFLSTLDCMTTMASREIADAVTDPDLGLHQRGWYDNVHSPFDNGEIGDIKNDRVMYVNGYAMQRVVNKDEFNMTPAQATSNHAVNFVLQPYGSLVEITGSGSTNIMNFVASVSDQGIDNRGHAMVDVVDWFGRAWEFHDTGGLGTWTSLGNGAKSAKAGQGVSYVLHNNGDLYEFDDATALSRFVRGSVLQIDAGTDVQGVNAVDVVVPGQLRVAMAARVVSTGDIIFLPPNEAYQYSDDSGAHFIASGMQSISAGRQGISAYVTTGGYAYGYNQLANNSWGLGSSVAQVTAGTDPNGNYMFDMLLSNGVLQEYRQDSGWYGVAGAVKNMSKGRLGAVDVVLSLSVTTVKQSTNVPGFAGGGVVVDSPPSAWEHTLSGWRLLSSSATAAV